MGSFYSKSAGEIIAPQPGPQALLVSCPCDDILYGGARGGGKSYGILIDWCAHEARWGRDARGILFRRTFPELEDMQVKAMEIFTAVGGRYLSSPRTWVFPSKAALKMRYLDRDADAANYQGHEYNWMGFDEAGNWPSPVPLDMLRACLRSAHGVKHRLVHSCNPGGVGHNWVKRRYIDPAPALTPFIVDGFTRVFIPAKVQDNRKLMQNDPGYVDRLRNTGADWLVKAWLHGDWDIVAGSFFGDAWSVERNVIKPFAIPKSWYCFRSFDWGSARPFSVGWWAIADGTQSPDGRIYPRGALVRFAEWYGARRDGNGVTVPNEGVKMSSRQVAQGIVERERRMKDLYGITVHSGPADPAIYASADGPCVADNMKAEGVAWIRADHSRLTGWQQLRERILGEEDVPMLYVFNTCTEIIRTLPAAPRDKLLVDDIDTNFEDHALDEARYAVMFRKREFGGLDIRG